MFVLVQLLLDFYCDRLKDRHVVIPHVLAGLCSLVLHHSLPDGAVRKICSAIYKEVHTQVSRQWKVSSVHVHTVKLQCLS